MRSTELGKSIKASLSQQPAASREAYATQRPAPAQLCRAFRASAMVIHLEGPVDAAVPTRGRRSAMSASLGSA